MKLVREKKFDSFNEGKEELLDLIPMSNILRIELSNCYTFEETYSKLSDAGTILLRINKDIDNKYNFKAIFIADDYMFIQNRFTYKNWIIGEDTIGVDPRLILAIENA